MMLFSNVFGGFIGFYVNNYNARTEVTLKVTLEELYNGSSRDIPYENRVVCAVCTGTGLITGFDNSVAAQQKDCERCHTSGMLQYPCILCAGAGLYNDIDGEPYDCGLCNGTGSKMDYCELCCGTGLTHMPQNRCGTCGGKTFLKTLQLANFQIMRGMSHGHTMEHAQGNLKITLKSIQHPVFRRQGDDLVMNLRIDLFESISGFSKVIRTLGRRGLLITNPAGKVISDGDLKCILNEGMPLLDFPNQKGRLIVSFEVNGPSLDQLNNEQYLPLPEPIPPIYFPSDAMLWNPMIMRNNEEMI